MPVSSEHRSYKKLKNKYVTIQDCLDGEFAVKAKTEAYLPKPNPEDESEKNTQRYNQYIERAVFYNVTNRTLEGFIGQIYARDPIVEVPEGLDILKFDANGAGVDIVQLSKLTCNYVIPYGRSGLFVDYPTAERTEGDAATLPVSKAQVEDGEVHAIIKTYSPLDVINWRTITRGSRTLLSLVVLKEKYTRRDDGFEVEEGTQYRVLRLDGDGLYFVELYQDSQTPTETFFPTDSEGKRLDEIPFLFVGSENNDSTVDEPPMFDLASLNIAHYRNSADYEEASYIVGQPTPYFTGLSQNWVDQVLKGEIHLGSRASIPLPPGATAGLLQPSPNPLPFTAMEHKEKQMVALGAKLVENRSVQRTAFETGVDHSAEMSTLSAAADNVSDAYVWALHWCARFMGVSVEETKREDQSTAEKSGDVIEFKLNTEFDMLKLTPEERRQLIEEWTANAISFTEMRENLRRGGIASRDDAAAKAEIDSQIAEKDAREKEKMKTQAELAPKPQPANVS